MVERKSTQKFFKDGEDDLLFNSISIQEVQKDAVISELEVNEHKLVELSVYIF